MDKRFMDNFEKIKKKKNKDWKYNKHKQNIKKNEKSRRVRRGGWASDGLGGS